MIIDSTNEKTFVGKNCVPHSLMLPALMVATFRIHKSLGRVAGLDSVVGGIDVILADKGFLI